MQPIKIKAADLEFLTALDTWIARGKPAYEFASEQGISPQTVTYRLNDHGFKMVRAEGLRHKFTGRMFRAMVEAGDYQVIAEEPAETVAA